METWKITKDRSKCDKPGCPLGAATDYFAVLDLPECVRRDLCERCFRQEEAKATSPLLFWRGHVREANKAPTLDLTSLRHLFDALGEEQEPERVELAAGLRYLIALLLLRKRWLKMVDARNEAEEAADLLVVDPKIEGMEPVALSAPPLEDDRLGVLKEELQKLAEC